MMVVDWRDLDKNTEIKFSVDVPVHVTGLTYKGKTDGRYPKHVYECDANRWFYSSPGVHETIQNIDSVDHILGDSCETIIEKKTYNPPDGEMIQYYLVNGMTKKQSKEYRETRLSPTQESNFSTTQFGQFVVDQLKAIRSELEELSRLFLSQKSNIEPKQTNRQPETDDTIPF